VNVRISSRIRIALALLFALALLTMQSVGVMHRIAHSSHADSHAQETTELWLIVANGGDVNEQAWQAAQTHGNNAANDPWHAHDDAVDCERFDAVCAAYALTHASSPPLVIAPTSFTVTRTHLATLAARMPRAHARAPPLA
jgi:hypothetical protein